MDVGGKNGARHVMSGQPCQGSPGGDHIFGIRGNAVLVEVQPVDLPSSETRRGFEAFDRTQPISGAELIVLSEHVDYWNSVFTLVLPV